MIKIAPTVLRLRRLAADLRDQKTGPPGDACDVDVIASDLEEGRHEHVKEMLLAVQPEVREAVLRLMNPTLRRMSWPKH